VREARIQTAQDRLAQQMRDHATNLYNNLTEDYEPGKNRVLDAQFKAAFGFLPDARKAKDSKRLVWVDGQPTVIGLQSGTSTGVTDKTSGAPVVDVGRRAAGEIKAAQVPKQRDVVIGGQKQSYLLTDNEAARLQQVEANRQQIAATATANRKSREGIAAVRLANQGAGTIAGAASALARYRAYDTRIEAERGNYNRPGVIQGLMAEQSALGRTMRQRFPNHIDFSNGAPELVTVEGAADRWREANPGKEPSKAQMDAWQKKIDAMGGVGGSKR